MPPPRVALFVPDLAEAPGRADAVALANRLPGEGFAVDLIAPRGGGPLRAGLDPTVGQIDLAHRHAATAALALARIVAERRPAILAVLSPVVRVGRLALLLARSGAALVVVTDAEQGLAAIRAAARRSD